MKNGIFAVLLTSVMITVGCSSDDEGSVSSSSNAISNSYSTITSKANAVTNLRPNSTSSLGVGTFAAPNYGSDWTTAVSPFQDETQASSTTVSPKDWMGIQLNSTAARTNGSKISMFGRLASGLSIFCAVGVGLSSGSYDSSGYPTVGSHTLTTDSTTLSKFSSSCGITDVPSGVSFTITVANPSDSTYYDKLLTITLPSDMGGGSQDYYIKSTSSAINVATVEVNSNGVHRTIVNYDVTNKVLKLEYISGPNAALSSNDHLAAYRLYIDENSDEGYMMALEHTKGSPDSYIQYILSGKPATSSSNFSLSMYSSGLSSGSLLEACVQSTDGNIATDGARCTTSTTALNGFSVSGSTVTGYAAAYNNANYNTLSETTNLSFTSTDFATAAFSTN